MAVVNGFFDTFASISSGLPNALPDPTLLLEALVVLLVLLALEAVLEAATAAPGREVLAVVALLDVVVVEDGVGLVIWELVVVVVFVSLGALLVVGARADT